MTNSNEPIFESEETGGTVRIRLPITAYILALVSAVFVTFGIMIVVAFSHLFLGAWFENAPRWVLASITPGAIALGLLSGFRSLQIAKRKARAK